jgi:hypothetical protein
MVRSMNTRRYILAGVITIGIFLLGLMMGFVIEGKRVTFVENLFDDQRAEFESSQLQYAYIQSLESKGECPGIYSIFFENLKELDKASKRLETYVQESKINDEGFNSLKREYTIEQLRYWLLSKQTRDTCDDDLVRVLYFFSNGEDCDNCEQQGFVLDYLKKVYGQKLLIFSLDADFEQEPMIPILKRQYEISEFPTLIIEDEKIEGFTDVDELQTKICSLFEKQPPECLSS